MRIDQSTGQKRVKSRPVHQSFMEEFYNSKPRERFQDAIGTILFQFVAVTWLNKTMVSSPALVTPATTHMIVPVCGR